MAIDLKSIKKTVKTEPPKFLVYGREKIGKTTFAAESDNPIFIFTEEGRGQLNLAAYPFGESEVAPSYGAVLEAVDSLATQQHDFKTLVIDSVTSLNNLMIDYVCAENGEPDILGLEKGSKFGYMKGFETLGKEHNVFLSRLTELQHKTKMAIVLIAHAAVSKTPSPNSDDYQTWSPDLNEKYVSTHYKKWADAILFFGTQRPLLEKDKSGKAKDKTGLGIQRIIYTEPSFSHVAGNRYKLPPEIPFNEFGTWSLIKQMILSNVTPKKEAK